MNDIAEAYSIYPSADGILELINSTKKKSFKRNSIKKSHYWNTVVDLLLAKELIALQDTTKGQLMVITDKGLKHLNQGGFGDAFLPLPKDVRTKSFKKHLEDITSLLTIFGILNAVILFTTQIKNPAIKDEWHLNITGAEFISISMYLLSLVVLWEIVMSTLDEYQDNFKFKLLYFLLASTTIGVGLLFFNQYLGFIYAIGVMLLFFGVVAFINWVLLHLLSLFIFRRNARWFSKNSKPISFVLFVISMFTTALIIKSIISNF